MEKLRIVRCSSSPWASLLHRVEKKTPDTWSPCGDYGWLNEATAHTTGTLYLIYRISLQNWGARNLLKNWLGTWVQSISGGSCWCTKDCSDNTLQPLQVPTYAIWTQNATQAFQRFMDQVCRGLEEFLFVYIDDTLGYHCRCQGTLTPPTPTFPEISSSRESCQCDKVHLWHRCHWLPQSPSHSPRCQTATWVSGGHLLASTATGHQSPEWVFNFYPM